MKADTLIEINNETVGVYKATYFVIPSEYHPFAVVCASYSPVKDARHWYFHAVLETIILHSMYQWIKYA